MFTLKALLPVVLALAIAGVQAAERHTVHFVNRCGRGTPHLIQNGKVLSTGADYTSNGPLIAAIAYLQTGEYCFSFRPWNCGYNGERCGTVETTLKNPTTPGSGSSTDISLIPPLAFAVPLGFGYYNGCNGGGAACNNPNCNTAFKVPSDTHVQVACQTNNVNLAITFC